MQYHPDKNPGCKDTEAKFKAISEAYDCLKDPQKRAAYDRFGHAAFQNGGGGGGGGAQDFGDFGDIFESDLRRVHAAAARRRSAAAARRGPALRHGDQRSRMRSTARRPRSRSTSRRACDPATAAGAEPGTAAPRRCRPVRGHGKVRAQQGFFVVERTCPTCHGAGEVIADPCRDCRGEGRVDKTKTLTVNIPPGVDEGTRIRLSGEGEAGAARRAAGRSLHLPPRRAARGVRARGHDAVRARADQLHHRGARRRDRRSPGSTARRTRSTIPPGIQSGKQLRQRGAGMPVLQGPRARRPGRRRSTSRRRPS